ncbi:MAG: hypothetical protein ACRC7U_09270 [Moraxella sp.]|jgi:hypothetical protein
MLSLVSLVLAAASLSGNGFWVIGVVMLAILALGFTRYRYVLGYFVLGMLYWLAVEGVQWLLSEIFALESPASYVAAIGFSMLPVLVILVWQPKPRSTSASANLLPRHAGHRPVVLEKDTDFNQKFVRHSAVFDSKN